MDGASAPERQQARQVAPRPSAGIHEGAEFVGDHAASFVTSVH
ncbi:hypothetical protein V5E97_07800 [Singulisphaera sp. Ch08]|uniref:Uncharacterized protein n=1 Tax=Singulisphaera sp. Ch08 TaxID=3120278 RepID=A0AAU7CLA0_9BACT